MAVGRQPQPVLPRSPEETVPAEAAVAPVCLVAPAPTAGVEQPTVVAPDDTVAALSVVAPFKHRQAPGASLRAVDATKTRRRLGPRLGLMGRATGLATVQGGVGGLVLTPLVALASGAGVVGQVRLAAAESVLAA